MDVDRTIEATLQRGGWLLPLYQTCQVVPEYLFLIDRISFRDHQSKFIEELIDRLKQEGVFITTYLFTGDPRVCFESDNESSPKRLYEIAKKYYQYNLVIASDAEIFFSTLNGELAPWMGQLAPWKKRTVLTPKPVENWGYQELELAQQFIVLPATPGGLLTLSQSLYQRGATYVFSGREREPLPELLRVRPHYWTSRNPPEPKQVEAMLFSLRKYLGKNGFYWLSACAVFPELHWNITIYLANILKSEEGDSLLEFCSPLDLARLPWFRYGYIPDWLRTALISTLAAEQRYAVRTALEKLLVTAIQGSVDGVQLKIAEQYHNFLPQLTRSILRLFARRAPEGSPFRDYLFLGFMTKQSVLATKAPDQFGSLLKKPRFRTGNSKDNWLTATKPAFRNTRLGILSRIPLWILALLAALLFWLLQPDPIGHTDFVNAVRFSRDALSVVSGADDCTICRWTIVNNRLQPQGELANPPPTSCNGKRLQPQGVLATTGQAVWSLAFFPKDNDRVAAGLENGAVQLWHLPTRQPVQEPLRDPSDATDDRVFALAFTDDSRFLFSGHGSGKIRVWQRPPEGNFANAPVEILSLSPQENYQVRALAISPDGGILVSAGSRNTLALWSLSALGQPAQLMIPQGRSDEYIWAVAFAPNTRLLATAHSNGEIKVWDVNQCLAGTCVERQHWQAGSSVRSVKFSSDGRQVVSGSDDGQVSLWTITNTSTDKNLLYTSANRVNAVDLVATDRDLFIVSGGDDYRVRLSRVQPGEMQSGGFWSLLREWLFPPPPLTLTAFRPDSLTYVEGSDTAVIV